jgi:hypothetical protein
MPRRERKSLLDIFLSRLKKPTTPPPCATQTTRPFQAISIYRGMTACAIAKRFSDHRFLARDAPQLPLAGCSMPAACECRYLKHKDRRSDRRRLADFGASNRSFMGQDRRLRRGRRTSD